MIDNDTSIPNEIDEMDELYLQTLLKKVDTNKYRLITEILDEAHLILENKADPLRESVDDTLREAAKRLVDKAKNK